MTAARIRRGAAGKAARVRLLLVDVDGVLTDGGIIYDAEGREIKKFHVRDGHGIKMAQRAKVEVGIITGRSSAAVDHRARDLGIAFVRQGALDKVAAWREVIALRGLPPEETAYVGDDVVDLPLLREVGFAAAPADAHSGVLAEADYVASRPGGAGAVREIIEFVLRAAGAWETVSAKDFEGVPR